MALALGCVFDPSATGVDGLASDAGRRADARETDASPAVPIDAAPGAADAGCPLALLRDCDPGGADGDLIVTGDDTIDTDTDPRCRTYVQTGGPDACLVHVGALSIADSATLRGVGSRPLILLADGDATIAGTLDVGSYRAGTTGAGANPELCATATAAEDDLGGAGGGAGGSFGDSGGAGGEGDSDDSIGGDGTAIGGKPGDAAGTPSFVRGGCAGGAGGDESSGGGTGGAGGAGGGAVLVAALGTLEVTATGAIRATGAGGGPGLVQAGGGGGGSGGMIALDAAAITIAGDLSCNGGGGGAGGARVSGTPTTGEPGDDGTIGLEDASGGEGTTTIDGEGDGGDGSAGTDTEGSDGTPSRAGAGAGGGGAGVIVIAGGYSGSGTVSPPASTP